MAMIYYDSYKLGLLWKANATAFQAVQLAAHVQAHISGSGVPQGCHLPEDKLGSNTSK